MRRIVPFALAALAGAPALATPQAVQVTPMEEKARQCSACHGGSGISVNALWPNLAGQKEAYLVKQLKDFRAGKRKDPLMAPITKPLTDKDIAEFAAYFSGIGTANVKTSLKEEGTTK